jgi:surface antigen
MQRERITNDIYVFASEDYAHVNASAIVTSQGTVLIYHHALALFHRWRL